MADIVLINARYSISYWGMEHALPIFRKRVNMPVQCLPLLAALAGPEHTVTIVDENVEEIDFDRLTQADIVGVTGMNVQRVRMRQICEELHARGIFTVVGGAWVTVQEDYFEGVADAIFVGEADQTWPLFLKQWQAGEHEYRYEQAERTNMELLPVPRLDLLKTKQYMFGTLQMSRGCPYQCEFCDIIVTFGRRPRLKTGDQVTAELDGLAANNLPFIFIVDDNLIGNKKAIKQLLPYVIRWQEKHGYPMTFFTEASIDLAEDEELMQLLAQMNCQSVFIGIESPNEAALLETKKSQNVREKSAGTLLERVHRIQDFGLDVWCGMIVGFDNDDATIFEAQKKFLTDARIAQAMVGILGAIPKTPLYKRLLKEGRLDPDDSFQHGTNFEPAQMSREEISEGYVRLMGDLYDPQAFFDRLDSLYLGGKFRYASHKLDYWRRKPWQWFRRMGYSIVFFVGAMFMLLAKVKNVKLRRVYRQRLLRLMWRRWEPELWFIYLLKCAGHYHFYLMTEQMKKHGAINHGTDEHHYAAATQDDVHVEERDCSEPITIKPAA